MRGKGIYNKRRWIIFLCVVLSSLSFFGPLKMEGRRVEAAGIATYACVMEASTRRVLYAENADIRMPMASTTKVLTAITALENCDDLSKEVVVQKEWVGIEGSSVYLQEGETLTVRDLLYGLMLRSGNDAAVALASSLKGNVKNFCMEMNKVAQKAGALHSHFNNPHGLPCKNHYTTATDLSLITCYAMENPDFCKIVATKYYEPRRWQNKNKLLRTYEGAIGVKTGYTKEAGRCLVAAAEREGMRLVCTLLHCPNDFEKAKKYFDDCYASYKMQKIFDENDVFSIDNGNKVLSARLSKALVYPMSDGEKEHVEYEIVPYDRQKSDDSVGVIKISLAKRLIFLEKLYKL